jgi:hypothetical protein
MTVDDILWDDNDDDLYGGVSVSAEAPEGVIGEEPELYEDGAPLDGAEEPSFLDEELYEMELG